jgi:hypothetical protein
MGIWAATDRELPVRHHGPAVNLSSYSSGGLSTSETVRHRKERFMRKRLAMVAASALAAVGIGLAMASPASAASLGVYQTKEDCQAAMAAAGGGGTLSCSYHSGEGDQAAGWQLADTFGG